MEQIKKTLDYTLSIYPDYQYSNMIKNVWKRVECNTSDIVISKAYDFMFKIFNSPIRHNTLPLKLKIKLYKINNNEYDK